MLQAVQHEEKKKSHRKDVCFTGEHNIRISSQRAPLPRGSLRALLLHLGALGALTTRALQWDVRVPALVCELSHAGGTRPEACQGAKQTIPVPPSPSSAPRLISTRLSRSLPRFAPRLGNNPGKVQHDTFPFCRHLVSRTAAGTQQHQPQLGAGELSAASAPAAARA